MRPLLATLLVLLAAPATWAQRVNALVAPFDSSRSGNSHLGRKTAMILNLELWQTLRVPPAGGKPVAGKILWLNAPFVPTSYAMADQAAAHMIDDPELVLWGRSWAYGGGTVVEAFLLLRGPLAEDGVLRDIWSVPLDAGHQLSVTAPREQVEFNPIVIRTDLLGDLNDPSGLKLYPDATTNTPKGLLGNDFEAMQHTGNAAEVRLPNGQTGWVHLPELSKSHSEVVDFTGGVIRIFRHDWNGAADLFNKVLDNSHSPGAVRVDACLYMAIAAAMTGKDSYSWIRRAYEINPYSRAVAQYLLMSRISDFNRLSEAAQGGPEGKRLLHSLQEAVNLEHGLFPANDPWLANVRSFLLTHPQ